MKILYYAKDWGRFKEWKSIPETKINRDDPVTSIASFLRRLVEKDYTVYDCDVCGSDRYLFAVEIIGVETVRFFVEISQYWFWTENEEGRYVENEFESCVLSEEDMKYIRQYEEWFPPKNVRRDWFIIKSKNVRRDWIIIKSS